jgi:hypothetical protein
MPRKDTSGHERPEISITFVVALQLTDCFSKTNTDTNLSFPFHSQLNTNTVPKNQMPNTMQSTMNHPHAPHSITKGKRIPFSVTHTRTVQYKVGAE